MENKQTDIASEFYTLIATEMDRLAKDETVDHDQSSMALVIAASVALRNVIVGPEPQGNHAQSIPMLNVIDRSIAGPNDVPITQPKEEANNE